MKFFIERKGIEKKQKTTSSMSDKRVKVSTKGLPIIIVPHSVQSMMSLYNIEEFLIKNKYCCKLIGRFVPSDEYQKRETEKPQKVLLTHNTKDSVTKFEVVDSVDTFSRADWYLLP